MVNSPRWFKIAELEYLSGVSRRTIHFYLQQKLIHPPARTGKTMAYYDETHLRKLSYIKREKANGLPLIAIRQNIEEIEQNQAGAFGTAISDAYRFEMEENKTEKAIVSEPSTRSTKS
ncbi:MerR family transcriptional regulator, partial [bacterium]|nr:MerR family transcriptional regulator [bacterium]